MKHLSKPIIFAVLVTIVISACSRKTETITTGGPEVVAFKALPFQLKDVKLLDGPFKHATELNIQSLLNYEPDRLLAKFRSEAGLKPKAEAYGGWEAMTIAGHSLGHYLSACALMYQTTGDQRFLDRVNYIVAELDTCQPRVHAARPQHHGHRVAVGQRALQRLRPGQAGRQVPAVEEDLEPLRVQTPGHLLDHRLVGAAVAEEHVERVFVHRLGQPPSCLAPAAVPGGRCRSGI